MLSPRNHSVSLWEYVTEDVHRGPADGGDQRAGTWDGNPGATVCGADAAAKPARGAELVGNKAIR